MNRIVLHTTCSEPGMLNRFREPVSGLTHLAGAVLASGGLIWLIVATWYDTPRMLAMIVYGVSLIALYASSAALHLIKAPDRVLYWRNRDDHSAIYLLIAGTYTPFCYALLTGAWRWGMLGVIWALALGGVSYKMLFPWKRDSHLSTLVYVGMGWLAIILLPQLLPIMPLPLILLVSAGGVIYTAGAFIYALDNPDVRPRFSFHDAWHLFVLVGSGLHFAG